MRRKKEKKRSIVREGISWFLFLALFILIIYLLVNFIGERAQVSGDAMEPALCNGDYILLDKFSYRFTNPKRFDVVLFPFEYQDDVNYLGRVIGLPGETVQIQDGQIYINGKVLEEDYGKEEIRNAGLASSVITLGQDEYFVLGDNRNNCTDSREPSVGNISARDIIGKAVCCIWPSQRAGLL